MEAESREDFDEKIRRYSNLVRKASERLDIGYSHGLVFGQPSYAPAIAFRQEDDDEPERLFDDD